MNPQAPTNEHLLLIRGTQWNHGLSPGELQRVMTDFYVWVDGLVQKGVRRGAQPLMEEGKLVAGAKGASVTDGAFAESKEAIAGYFLLAVSSVAVAVKPPLANGSCAPASAFANSRCPSPCPRRMSFPRVSGCARHALSALQRRLQNLRRQPPRARGTLPRSHPPRANPCNWRRLNRSRCSFRNVSKTAKAKSTPEPRLCASSFLAAAAPDSRCRWPKEAQRLLINTSRPSRFLTCNPYFFGLL